MTDLLNMLPDGGWPRFASDVLWQTSAIGGLAWLSLRCLAKQPAARTWVATLAVIAMLLTPALSMLVRNCGQGWLPYRAAAAGLTEPARGAAFDGALRLREAATAESPLHAAVQEPPSHRDRMGEHELAAMSAATAPPSVLDLVADDPRAPSTEHGNRDAWWNWVAIAWGTVSFVLAVRFAAGAWQLRAIVRTSRDCADVVVHAACRDATVRLGLSRSPQLLLSRRVTVPAVTAILRQRLLIPDPPPERTEVQWYGVLCHELAHIRRRDNWASLLMELAGVALPWQPWLWWLRREHGSACEDACDDWVTAAGTDPLDFAAALADWSPRRRPSLALGVAGGFRSTQLRIQRLLRQETPPVPQMKSRLLLGWLVVALLLIAGISGAQTARDAPTQVADAASTEQVHLPQEVEDPGTPLPGLIPAPAALPGGGRWQIAPRIPHGHTTSIAWSPDSRSIAFAESGNIRIHDAQSLELQRILVGHRAMVRSIAWSPDGRWIASAGDDGTARLWSAEWRPVGIVHRRPVAIQCVTWKPDSLQIASGSADGAVCLCDLNGLLIQEWTEHTGPVRAIAWKPTGGWIASAGDDTTVRLWSADGSIRSVLRGHAQPVTCLAWRPQGDRLVSGDANPQLRYEPGSLRVWNPNGGTAPVVLQTSRGCTGVAWSADGKRIVSGGAQYHVQMWNPAGGSEGGFGGNRGELECLAWSPNGANLAAAGLEDSLHVWSESGETLRSLPKRVGQKTWSLSWSAQGDRIAAGDRRGEVHLWRGDGTPGPRLHMGEEGESGGHWALQALDWSPDGTQLAAGAADTAVWLWGENGNQGPQLSAAGAHAVCAAWSPDGQSIALGGTNHPVDTINSSAWIQIWSSDAQLQRRLGELPRATESLAWSPDSRKLVAGCFDGTVRVLELDGNDGRVMTGHNAWVISVDWSSDGRWMASGGLDKMVRLWQPDGTPGPVLAGHTGDIRSVAFSPDSRWIASGAWDNTVRLWQPDGTAGPVLRGHDSWVYSVAWGPDSKRLISGGLDGVLRVWNIETAQVEWLGLIVQDGQAVSWSADGRVLHGATATIDRNFVYLVEAADGAMETLTAADFRRRTAGGARGAAATETP